MPDKLAVADESSELTYGKLYDNILRVAYILKQEGISNGSKVMIEAIPKTIFVTTYFAIQCLHAICVPFSSKAKDSWINTTIAFVQSECIINSKKNDSLLTKQIQYENVFLENVEDACNLMHNIDENEISDILFTSGTTGNDKGVVLSYRSTYAATCNIHSVLKISKSDTVLLPLPLHHSNALGTMRTYLKIGGSIVLCNGVMAVQSLKSLIEKYHCTAISCSPIMLNALYLLTQGKYVTWFQAFKHIEIGTAPVDSSLVEKLRNDFEKIKLYINYGATEAPRAIYMDLNIRDTTKLISIGKPIGDYKAVIIDDNDQIINKPNKIGRLALHSKALMLEYWNNTKLTKQSHISEYFLTGDLAYIDRDQYVILKGRIKDLIIIGGEKVYPMEVEDELIKLPCIEECAISSGLREKNGIEFLIAYIKLNPLYEFSKQEVLTKLREKLDKYKIPREFRVVDHIPRNQMGKIDRKQLKH